MSRRAWTTPSGSSSRWALVAPCWPPARGSCAQGSAAVRNVATLGGNLAAPFPEADLVPPLLSGQAVVEVALPDGPQIVDVEAWLRGPRRPEALITAVRMPLAARRRAAFERLTVRGGAEYAIASVAVSADLAE